MWSREGLKNAHSSIYRSTPHLFVYQPTLDDDEEADVRAEEDDDEPSDSGYADSTRSAGAGSAGSETTPEAIYYTTSSELAHQSKEKDAIRRLSQIGCPAADNHEGYTRPAKKCVPAAAPLTELEILRVETFFRGHQTQLFVGRSLANLYFRQTNSLMGLNRCSSTPDVCVRTLQRQSDRVTDWELKYTGIPVVLLDAGGTKSRRQRRIQLILAERDTGFTLWKDTIDNLSNYEAAGPTFHTMRTSVDHRQIAGLSFDSAEAAKELFDYIEKLTSDPANIRLSAPKCSRTGSLFRFFKNSKSSESIPAPKDKKKTSKAIPRKCEISQPCFFQHVTSVDLTDRSKFYTLQSLVPPQ